MYKEDLVLNNQQWHKTQPNQPDSNDKAVVKATLTGVVNSKIKTEEGSSSIL